MGSCGLCHKLVIAEHGTQKKRKLKPKPSLLVVFATSWSLLNMAHKKKRKPKPKPSLLVVFATSWSLLNMAQKQKTKKKETETEAKPSCGLCHKLVIAEHGTKTNKKKETETEAHCFPC